MPWWTWQAIADSFLVRCRFRMVLGVERESHVATIKRGIYNYYQAKFGRKDDTSPFCYCVCVQNLRKGIKQSKRQTQTSRRTNWQKDRRNPDITIMSACLLACLHSAAGCCLANSSLFCHPLWVSANEPRKWSVTATIFLIYKEEGIRENRGEGRLCRGQRVCRIIDVMAFPGRWRGTSPIN